MSTTTDAAVCADSETRVRCVCLSFWRTLSNILTSPDFPGWLAPIRTDADRLSTTLEFAEQWAIALSVAHSLAQYSAVSVE